MTLTAAMNRSSESALMFKINMQAHSTLLKIPFTTEHNINSVHNRTNDQIFAWQHKNKMLKEQKNVSISAIDKKTIWSK